MFGQRAARVLIIVIVMASGLALLPGAYAQDGEPERTGIRPDAPPYGVRGPHPVGATAFTAGDEARMLDGMIWYPALNPDGVEEAIAYDLGLGDMFPPEINLLPGQAILDAAADVDGGPYPLVIYSHTGLWVWQPVSYLFEHLASHGFVVMAFYHPGTSVIDTVASESEEETFEAIADSFVLQSRDISSAIDYAEDATAVDGVLAGAIDTERVAVMGHSLGGNAVLMASGARLDFSPVVDWCKLGQFATDSMAMLCGYYGEDTAELEAHLVELAGVEVQPGEMWPAIADPRVDAIVPMMAGPVAPILGADGLANITLPMLQLKASEDSMGINEFCADVIWANVGSANKTLVTFQGADHMLVPTGCSTVWKEEFFWWCHDPVWDVDRARDLIDHFVTAFLLAELTGDQDAAAALAPEAAQFPGIQYETTGF